MTKIDDAWLKADASAFRNAGMENIHPAGAAQDPELAKYQRAMPDRPLTKSPGHYLTGYEGSPCDKPEPIRCGKFKYQIQGIDTDEFKKQCEEIERGES